MALQEFKVASLATIDDGRVAAALTDELRRAVKDCLDRPAEKKPRRVALVFEIKPGFVDDTGDCEEVKVSHALRNSLPARRSREFSMMPSKNGSLRFNDMSPGDVRQMTLDTGGETPSEVKEPQ